MIVPLCFFLRPRVSRPRVFHQNACFTNPLFSTLRDPVPREPALAFSTYPNKFVCCSTYQLIYFWQDAWRTILFEVTRSVQRLAKGHDETKPKLSHFLPIESLPEMNQTHLEVLPWMAWSEIQVESLFRCTSLQDGINLIKLVRFRSYHGRETWMQSSVITDTNLAHS